MVMIDTVLTIRVMMRAEKMLVDTIGKVSIVGMTILTDSSKSKLGLAARNRRHPGGWVA
jgi:hypothetical protein